jgi:uncharacterized protein YfaS (alpha-2-macroglobulin family)
MTFSRPLVPITSQAELAKIPAPAKLTPEPPGEWRWLGVQTVSFQPLKRFPMATDYRVEIPAGTKSVTGEALAVAEAWTFSTPPPKLVRHLPDTSAPVDLEPILYVEFDQGIDRDAVLASIRMTADGGGAVPLRLATESEIESSKTARPVSAKAQPKTWLAFRGQGKLPPATSLTVHVGPGTPSAEGPKRTTSEESFGLRTHGLMRLVRARCGWSDTPCPPLTPWTIEMSNPIDAKTLAKSTVKVDPDLPGLRVSASGQYLTVEGRAKGRTRYTVRVAPTLGDVFGQTLGSEASATIDVGPAEPALFPEHDAMSVLDPAAAPALPVYSINEQGLRVRLYAVTPEDWRAYTEFRAAWDREAKETRVPGRLVANKVVATNGAPDELVETAIDLRPALGPEGLGQVVAIVEPTHPTKRDWSRRWVRTWIQVTKLGLEAFIDAEDVVAWTTDLATGAPAAGVDVSVLKAGGAKSGADGIARVPLTADPGELLFARRGPDVVILPERYAPILDYRRVASWDDAQWLVLDDRHMYRPGDEPHLKGFLRRRGTNKGGDLTMTPDVGKDVTWTARDARGAEVAKGRAPIDEAGGFDLTFKVPASANLGPARVELDVDGSALSGAHHAHALSFEEFRRPEFEVRAETTSGPHIVGGHAVATVSATYYAGGGLPNADVAWAVRATRGHFTPPNRALYAFGPETVWSRGRREDPELETWTAKTSPSGSHRLRIDFDALERPGPLSLQLSATVTDVNRQAWAANANLLVHPAAVYVGLKAGRGFVSAGEPLQVEAIASDLEGKLVAGRKIQIKAARLEWEQQGDEWTEKERDASTCEVESAASAVRCSLATNDGGTYLVSATITDADGRKSLTEMRAWVLAAKMPAARDLTAGVAQLVTDKEEYKPGDTAEVLVRAPFAPAEGVLTVRRQGIVKLQRFTMKSAAETLTVKIEDGWAPGVGLAVNLSGAEPRGEDSKLTRPAFAAGAARLKIPPRDRALLISAEARDNALEPGATTIVDLDAKDAQGKPAAGAELAVAVVDEAVLALSSYKLPDPMEVFYTQRPDGARAILLRDRILLSRDDEASTVRGARDAAPRREAHAYARTAATDTAAPAASAPAPAAKPAEYAPVAGFVGGLDEDKLANTERTAPMALRTDFAAIALFVPKVTTDAQGRAHVTLKLPDTVTRYRIMAVAAHGENRFGSAESTVTARLPLMVRPSPPRFLNYGDAFEMPIVLQNQTDKEMLVDVAMRATNAKVDAVGRRVAVPANDRVEVRIPASTVRAGTARFQIGAASGRASDASQLDLAVWTPATTEAFATYGTVDDGAIAQPVKMPTGVVPELGGLEITTSSTALQALTDAVLYLVQYPYECNEQISSRLVSIAALRDVLGAFRTKDMPAPDVLLASVKKDTERLRARQASSGGWGFWPGGEAHPWVTVHVTHALVRTKDKGFEVDPEVLARAAGYLKSIEARIPPYWPDDARRALIAYALDVRWRMKDVDRVRAKRLLAEAGGADRLPIEADGWILQVLSGDPGSSAEVAQIRRHLANRVTETAGAAHFVASYKDADHLILSSDRRADGVILDALIGDQPQNDVIPKVVAGLLAHRKAGHWTNTQENAFVLLALDRYFATYEKTTPDFVARAWLGDRYGGEHAFKGRTTERHQVNVPMQQLADFAHGADLVVQKDGPGRLYYRIGLQYAPNDLRPPPIDRGFTVTRSYEGVDAASDVTRDADGSWHVKAGAKVRVRLLMVAPARRYHVALVDPLPAGFEAVNPALAVSGPIPQDPKAQTSQGGWRGTWYEHQNLRDERVEAFASLLWEGAYDYAYVARATTPGTFVVAPPKAEEMYSPETFGRGATDRVIVE